MNKEGARQRKEAGEIPEPKNRTKLTINGREIMSLWTLDRIHFTTHCSTVRFSAPLSSVVVGGICSEMLWFVFLCESDATIPCSACESSALLYRFCLYYIPCTGDVIIVALSGCSLAIYPMLALELVIIIIVESKSGLLYYIV